MLCFSIDTEIEFFVLPESWPLCHLRKKVVRVQSHVYTKLTSFSLDHFLIKLLYIIGKAIPLRYSVSSHTRLVEIIFLSVSIESCLFFMSSWLLGPACEIVFDWASVRDVLNCIVESCTEWFLLLPQPSVLIVPLTGLASKYIRWLRSTMKQLLYLLAEEWWWAMDKQEKCLKKIQFSNYIATVMDLIIREISSLLGMRLTLLHCNWYSARNNI